MAIKKIESAVHYGPAIRAVRERMGCTREQLAARAGITPRYLASIESEEKKPSLGCMTKLIHALGCSADEVFYPDKDKVDARAEEVARLFSSCTEHDKELIWVLINKMNDK